MDERLFIFFAFKMQYHNAPVPIQTRLTPGAADDRRI
jgi:hypothetical protein